jgi:hypothetical protein
MNSKKLNEFISKITKFKERFFVDLKKMGLIAP